MINTTLERPTFVDAVVQIDHKGRPSIRFATEDALVSINPETHGITTVMGYDQEKLTKLMKKHKNKI